jgi:DNA repair protein RecO (recombination protein O)
MQHDLQLAYILHSRPYRETSLLLDAFTLEHGRIALVARGVKRGRAKLSAILQPFLALNMAWYGNGELVTLTHVEQVAVAPSFSVKRTICGLYINELLTKILPKWDPCEQLFAAYQLALQELHQPQMFEQATLRKFEKQLLKSIGYGLQLTTEVTTGLTIEPDQYYILDPLLGPRLTTADNLDAVLGLSLLALDADDYSSEAVLADLKRVMRYVLAHHLGSNKIIARELF